MCNSLAMRWNRSFDCMERNIKDIEGLWPQSKCACFQGEQVLWDIRTLVILQNAATIRMQFLCVGFFLSHPPAFWCFVGSHLQSLPSYNNITAKGRMVTVMGKNQTTCWCAWEREDFLHDFTVFVFWVCQETASISPSNCSCLYTGFERSSIFLTWN